MPTYVYACDACKKEHELVQPITDDPVGTCPGCGAPGPRRLVTGGAGFVLVGGGWARDLYASRPTTGGN